jgi:hypothetical protein
MVSVMAQLWAFISENYLQIQIMSPLPFFYYLFVYVRGTKTAW